MCVCVLNCTIHFVDPTCYKPTCTRQSRRHERHAGCDEKREAIFEISKRYKSNTSTGRYGVYSR